MKLRKFHELINWNAKVTLTQTRVSFEGSVKDIPDAYDSFTVSDFTMRNKGDFLS